MTVGYWTYVSCLVCRFVKREVMWHRSSSVSLYMREYSIIHHRLRGSASPVLTATHHSHGSPRLSDFFPSRLWGSDPSTNFHAKWLKRRIFTQGCAFCSKSRYFSYPLISRPHKRSKFRKFLDLEIFRSILAFNITVEVTERTPLILHRSPMKVA